MASLKQCIKCATTPFIKLGNKIEQTAVAKSAAAPAGIKAQVAAHNVAGTDFATTTAQHIWKNRSSIFWYRVERVFIEGRAVASGEYFKGYNYKLAIVDAHFLTRFIFCFIVGVMVGRKQVFPFVTPSSPYALEMH